MTARRPTRSFVPPSPGGAASRGASPRRGATRTQLLGLVAGGLVLVLLLSQLGPPATDPAASPTGAAPAAVTSSAPAPVGAPRALGAQALRARYEPIARVAPFKPRSFRAPAAPRPGPAAPTPERPRYSPPPDPKSIELRLTGFLGQGPARTAILEDPSGQGRGILARAGDALGAAQVAAVQTDSLVVALAPERPPVTIALGEPVVLPLDAAARLGPLRPDAPAAPADGVAATTTGGATAAPPQSEDDKKALLERLRARRSQQLGSGGK